MITCKKGVDRKKVVPFIESNGVQTRMLFAGNLTKHPCFDQMRDEKKGYRVVGDLTNTDYIMENSFWVGVYPGMTDAMIDYMAETIKKAVSSCE
jgi:CDP-6-deoxy-D-xylo-4-hexulose-3-dehydrase